MSVVHGFIAWFARHALCVAVLVCLGLWPVPRLARAADDPAPSIVSLPLRVEGSMSEASRRELDQALRRGLERSALRVVEATAAAANCDAPACAVQEASASSVDYALLVRIVVERRDYEVTLDVVDAGDAKVVATSREHCEVYGLAEVVELIDTQTAALSRRLQALRLGAPVLTFESRPPGALVRIDGELVGETPLQRVVEPGPRVVTMELAGHVPQTREIEVVSGVKATVELDLARVPRSVRYAKLRVFGWTALGVGVAAVAVGAPLIAVHGRENRLVCSGDNVDPRGNCKYLYATRGPGIGATVVGVALVATAIAIVVGTRDRRPDRRSAFGIGPRGFVWTGRF